MVGWCQVWGQTSQQPTQSHRVCDSLPSTIIGAINRHGLVDSAIRPVEATLNLLASTHVTKLRFPIKTFPELTGILPCLAKISIDQWYIYRIKNGGDQRGQRQEWWFLVELIEVRFQVKGTVTQLEIIKFCWQRLVLDCQVGWISRTLVRVPLGRAVSSSFLGFIVSYYLRTCACTHT